MPWAEIGEDTLTVLNGAFSGEAPRRTPTEMLGLNEARQVSGDPTTWELAVLRDGLLVA